MNVRHSEYFGLVFNNLLINHTPLQVFFCLSLFSNAVEQWLSYLSVLTKTNSYVY